MINRGAVRNSVSWTVSTSNSSADELNGNGKRGARNGRSGEDRLMSEIFDALDGLSTTQRQQVLFYIQSLKQKAE